MTKEKPKPKPELWKICLAIAIICFSLFLLLPFIFGVIFAILIALG